MALDFALDEEQQLIRRSVRDVLAPFRERRREFFDLVVRRQEFPLEIWEALSAAGYLGCVLPEAYGGSNMGLLALALVVEEMATLGFGNAILILTAMDALCIEQNGPDAVRKRFLPEIAAGRARFCFALTEADAGSNTFRIQTSAERHGDSYVINGSKTFITGVDAADYMLLATRTKRIDACSSEGLPKGYGLSLFIVPTGAKGITRHPIPTRGIEGMKQFALFFENLEVPAENLVGVEHQGAMAIFKALNPERILAAATAVGITRYCLRTACDYARERKVFASRSIGSYQGIQHPLADVRLRQEAVRLTTYKAAWAYDHGLPGREVGFLANAAKYLAAELGLQAVDAAIETLGGNGFSEDYGIAHLWEAMRLLKTAPISKEMILNYTAEHTLDLPRSY